MARPSRLRREVRRARDARCQPEDPEGRERDGGRPRLTVRRLLACAETTTVADVGAPVEAAVGIEQLFPPAWPREPDAVLVARERREVGDAHDRTRPARVGADEGEH